MSTITLDDVAQAAWSELGDETFPVDSPAWATLSRWSVPLTTTKVTYVAANSGWIDILSYTIPFEWSVVIKKIMMTSEGDQITNGMQFRIRQGRAIPGWLTTAPGIDLGKTSATSYPAIERDFPIVTDRNNAITLQVNNTSGVAVRAIVGLFGWIYKTNTDNGTGNRSGISDV
jgi:hypothetical protein